MKSILLKRRQFLVLLAVLLFTGCPGLLSNPEEEPITLDVPVINGISIVFFNTDITFTISGGKGLSIEYSFDDGTNWNDYSKEVTISAEGTYALTARQKDSSGNVSEKTPVLNFILDKTAPALPQLIGLAEGFFNTALTFTLSGEEGALIEYSLDGGTTWLSYSEEVSIPDEGTYELVVRQTDKAGNTSAVSTPVKFTLDKSLPDAPALAGLTAGLFNSDLSFSLSGEEDSILEYSLDNGDTWNTYTAAVSLTTEGAYSIIVRQIDSAGNVSAQSTPLVVSLDKTIPTVSMTSGTSLATDASLVFKFSESMDTAGLTTSGNLTSGLTGMETSWSKTTVDNDTLTISPGSGTIWNIKAGSDLILNGKDKAGNSTGDKSFTPDFVTAALPSEPSVSNPNNEFYVNKDFTGTSTGMKSAPYKTIGAALNAATAETVTSIYVASGTYMVTKPLIMKEKVSLYGGYNASDWSRDISGNETIIQDGGTPASINSGILAYTIYGDSGISSATIIEGFTIIGINDNSSYLSIAISLENGSSPTIKSNCIYGGNNVSLSCGIQIKGDQNTIPIIANNTIKGGIADQRSIGIYVYPSEEQGPSPSITGNSIFGGSGSYGAYGINNMSGNIVVQNNTIEGGSSPASVTIGIYDQPYTNSLIQSNTVNGGSGTNNSTGIMLTGGSSLVYNNVLSGSDDNISNSASMGISTASSSIGKIYNNTINGGDGFFSWCINCDENSSPSIINNILYSTTESNNNSCGIYESNSNSNPVIVKNCCFFDLKNLYHDSRDGTDDNDISTLNAEILAELSGDSTASVPTVTGGLVAADPQFVSASDFHLSADSPSSVTTGGQNLNDAGITTDKDGNARIAPWSMGAYEKD